MRRRAAVVAALLLAATGCASSDADLRREILAERLEAMTIVSRAEIKRNPPGSPSRAILTLWRAVQFRDPQTALARVSPRPSPKQLEGFEVFIVGLGAQTAATTKPRIVTAKQFGRRAEALVEFVRHRKVGDKVRAYVTGRLEVELVRSGTRWLLLWRKAARRLPKVIS